MTYSTYSRVEYSTFHTISQGTRPGEEGGKGKKKKEKKKKNTERAKEEEKKFGTRP